MSEVPLYRHGTSGSGKRLPWEQLFPARTICRSLRVRKGKVSAHQGTCMRQTRGWGRGRRVSRHHFTYYILYEGPHEPPNGPQSCPLPKCQRTARSGRPAADDLLPSRIFGFSGFRVHNVTGSKSHPQEARGSASERGSLQARSRKKGYPIPCVILMTASWFTQRSCVVREGGSWRGW